MISLSLNPKPLFSIDFVISFKCLSLKPIFFESIGDQNTSRDEKLKNLIKVLEKNGFKIKKRHLIFSEPFNLKKLSDPKKIWPIILDQNIWAEIT